MGIKSNVCLIIAFIIIWSNCLNAQEDVLRPKGRQDDGYSRRSGHKVYNRISFGIEFAANYNSFKQDVIPVNNQMSEILKSQNGYSPYFSMMLDYYINKIFALEIKASLDWKSFRNSKTEKFDYSFDPSKGNVLNNINTETIITIESEAEFSTETKGLYFGLGLLGKVFIYDKLFVCGGPIVLLPIGDFTLKNSCDIVEPVFIKSSKMFKPTEVENPNYLYGLEIGAGYQFQIAKNVDIAPVIRYQFLIPNFADDFTHSELSEFLYPEKNIKIIESDKKLSSFQFGIQVLFNF